MGDLILTVEVVGLAKRIAQIKRRITSSFYVFNAAWLDFHVFEADFLSHFHYNLLIRIRSLLTLLIISV